MLKRPISVNFQPKTDLFRSLLSSEGFHVTGVEIGWNVAGNFSRVLNSNRAGQPVRDHKPHHKTYTLAITSTCVSTYTVACLWHEDMLMHSAQRCIFSVGDRLAATNYTLFSINTTG